ncbi:hypothetical protein ScalyP_jg9555, partial [Parmales sp. scaly parma]
MAFLTLFCAAIVAVIVPLITCKILFNRLTQSFLKTMTLNNPTISISVLRSPSVSINIFLKYFLRKLLPGDSAAVDSAAVVSFFHLSLDGGSFEVDIVPSENSTTHKKGPSPSSSSSSSSRSLALLLDLLSLHNPIVQILFSTGLLNCLKAFSFSFAGASARVTFRGRAPAAAAAAAEPAAADPAETSLAISASLPPFSCGFPPSPPRPPSRHAQSILYFRARFGAGDFSLRACPGGDGDGDGDGDGGSGSGGGSSSGHSLRLCKTSSLSLSLVSLVAQPPPPRLPHDPALAVGSVPPPGAAGLVPPTTDRSGASHTSSEPRVLSIAAEVGPIEAAVGDPGELWELGKELGKRVGGGGA